MLNSGVYQNLALITAGGKKFREITRGEKKTREMQELFNYTIFFASVFIFVFIIIHLSPQTAIMC